MLLKVKIVLKWLAFFDNNLANELFENLCLKNKTVSITLQQRSISSKLTLTELAGLVNICVYQEKSPN